MKIVPTEECRLAFGQIYGPVQTKEVYELDLWVKILEECRADGFTTLSSGMDSYFRYVLDEFPWMIGPEKFLKVFWKFVEIVSKDRAFDYQEFSNAKVLAYGIPSGGLRIVNALFLDESEIINRWHSYPQGRYKRLKKLKARDVLVVDDVITSGAQMGRQMREYKGEYKLAPMGVAILARLPEMATRKLNGLPVSWMFEVDHRSFPEEA